MRLQESINILFTSIKRLNVRMLLVRRYKLPYFAISNIKFPHGEKKGLPAIHHAFRSWAVYGPIFKSALRGGKPIFLDFFHRGIRNKFQVFSGMGCLKIF